MRVSVEVAFSFVAASVDVALQIINCDNSSSFSFYFSIADSISRRVKGRGKVTGCSAAKGSSGRR